MQTTSPTAKVAMLAQFAASASVRVMARSNCWRAPPPLKPLATPRMSEAASSYRLVGEIFSAVLLLCTISSNPLVHQMLGFRRIGFGPLLMFPEVFACIASAVLLYLSRQ